MSKTNRPTAATFIASLTLACVMLTGPVLAERPDDRLGALRIATYNVSLYRDRGGQLAEELAGESPAAEDIAEVLQRVRPDIVLLNEFDYDSKGTAASRFHDRFLARPQAAGLKPLNYAHRVSLPVNTGRPSGRDLNKDGELDGPADAIGFGRHEGQYGMLLLSRHPIDRPRIRTFRELLWRAVPNALLPVDDEGDPFYDESDLKVLRLSSKSHWDVPVKTAAGVIHVLACHPTPPVFDGKEDRNGRRNHDELRLWADYLTGGEAASYIRDDRGRTGGLAEDASFVLLGDLNADPERGDSRPGAIAQLLEHPRVDASPAPLSPQGGSATALFSGPRRVRVDYVLPSRGLQITDSGVYWPAAGEPGAEAVKATDHRLVWIDIQIPQP